VKAAKKSLVISLFVAFYLHPVAPATANSPAVTFSQTFTANNATSASVKSAWTTFRSALTGTYTQFTFSSTFNNTSITVSDPTKVQTLANAMLNSTSASAVIGSNTWSYSWSSSWDEFGNAGYGNCTSTSTTFVVRPRIPNENWGGVGGSTCYAQTQTITLTFGQSTPQLSTPAAPILTNSGGTGVLVSETSTVANASSYIINLYASNGTTFLESRTVASSAITSTTLFSGLTPLTTYRVGVVAKGDGINYTDSAQSALSSITLSAGVTTVSITLSPVSNRVVFRKSSTLVANVSGTAGRVTFFENKKRIAKCISLPTTSFSASCTYNPSSRGSISLTARFIPSTGSYTPSDSSVLLVLSERRTDAR
jgi:hypothetical protein